ncbi:hypothetical protein LTR56_019865 [Elasticomyces elasticus]|nr:hypothetical protein LTR22_023228 [Elasticomyces elasticus]KAK3626390.1 hypothetical protein LTR56_019865 [Elasticomyces elasticus]KAK4907348.1 hypothetical protein LTR49_023632 [Elasticomyces elasticus]KAK5748382.1 hypothetical protein LTS12_021554 [Elasticomyces elasticus]
MVDLITNILIAAKHNAASTQQAGQGYNDSYFHSLPFDQQMARISLQHIKSGPEGVESMSKCRCNTMEIEIEGVDESRIPPLRIK